MRNYIEYRFTDKSGWEQGVWQDEPDKVQWIDEETGLDCLIVRNPGGALCGYVGVAEGHSLFEVSYSELYDRKIDLECHGGLTRTSFCVEDEKEHGICHLPKEGRPDRIWWFGFDCSHSDDLSPMFMKSDDYPQILMSQAIYRTMKYTTDSVTDLAKQLASIQ